MRIGLISDIHCHLAGLSQALALLDDCDEILCAGDLMSQYRFSAEVLRMLRLRGVQSILGNHDQAVLHLPHHPLRQSPTVPPEELAYLASLPDALELRRDGRRVAVFHGAPWDTARSRSATYVYPHDSAALSRIAALGFDAVVLGHTHLPMVASTGRGVVLNPGSCGEARAADGMLSCAALDLDSMEVDVRRFKPPDTLGGAQA